MFEITLQSCQLLLLFYWYSFLGWAVESAICSATGRKLVNRGFLNGPVCPVYGVGALACIYLLAPVAGQPVLLYLLGTILVSIVEYFTGWLLETLFHTRWWDYSHYRFNLKGRVCLPNALFFGILALFAMRVLHPASLRALGRLGVGATFFLAGGLSALFLADLVVSVRAAIQLSGKLDKVHAALGEARQRADASLQKGRLQAALFAAMTPQERLEALRELGVDDALLERIARLVQRQSLLHRRLMAAFPHMQFPRSPASLEALRAAWDRLRRPRKKK